MVLGGVAARGVESGLEDMQVEQSAVVDSPGEAVRKSCSIVVMTDEVERHNQQAVATSMPQAELHSLASP